MDDAVIPIVFPDYLITVHTPRVVVEVPDFLPFIDILPDSIRIPARKNQIPELGHAGVLFFNGKNGRTKYFEYGRYDKANLGLTRRVPVTDLKLASDKLFRLSLTKTLREISLRAGHNTRISAAFIQVPGRFAMMLEAARKRVDLNRNPKRKPYDTVANSCLHFMQEILEAAGVDTPVLIDPRPNSYIVEIRDEYPDLDYDPATNRLVMKK